jgi:hypothetical protein
VSTVRMRKRPVIAATGGISSAGTGVTDDEMLSMVIVTLVKEEDVSHSMNVLHMHATGTLHMEHGRFPRNARQSPKRTLAVA